MLYVLVWAEVLGLGYGYGMAWDPCHIVWEYEYPLSMTLS
jgi:hypothetical protein